ncbi:type I-E CRISPR-associated protein Cas5/CasD [Streptomyces smyrnaeus]|uniref:type I-E CRISPR-associated protein Cas5/CasD n=1 Tax=Streptomyces smyrnaeus TaxID=1387713 RepID=UPI00369A7F8D
MLLRLAGPLQSWGERSVFGNRDTLPFPTRSGLIGMFAAAQGRHRDQNLDAYGALGFTVRIDRPGRLIEDFHTVGGGLPASRGLPTSEGKRRDTALVSRRHYLSDAVFVVAVTGPDRLLAQITDALETPVWAPSLGRRACMPDEPLLLHADAEDPVRELTERVPLSLGHQPAPGRKTVPVDFVWDTPPEGMAAAQRYETTDVPLSFTPGDRRFGSRPLWRTTEELPATLYAPRPSSRALIDYTLAACAKEEPA